MHRAGASLRMGGPTLIVFLALCALISGGCAQHAHSPTRQGYTPSCSAEGDQALQAGDTVAAIGLYKTCLADNPYHGATLYYLGYAYGMTENRAKEIEYYRQALACGFKDNSIYYNMGMALAEMHQPGEALEMFFKARKRTPDDPEIPYAIAQLYIQQESSSQAEFWYLKTIKLAPDYLDARLNLAILYAERKQYPQSVAQLEAILKHDSSHAMTLDFLKQLRESGLAPAKEQE